MRLRSPHTLILTLLLVLGTSYYYFGLLLPASHRQSNARQMATRYAWGGDFYPIWLTGRALFAERSNPYTPETTRKIQIGLYGRPMDRPIDPSPDYRAFSYPIYTDLLAAPLLLLGFETVRVVLSVLLFILTVISVVVWLKVLRISLPLSILTIFILLTLVSYPALEGLYAVQPGMFVAATIAFSIAALASSNYWLAGILLAVASVKPQMVWPLALFLITWSFGDWKQRKGIALGFLVTLVALFAASWALLPAWFSGWLHALATYSSYTQPPLLQLLLGRILDSFLSLTLLGFIAVVCWKNIGHPVPSPEFSLCVSLVLAVTALLLPSGVAVYDQIILLPAIFWLWSRRGEISKTTVPVRVLAVAAVVALFWQWVVACGVAVASLVSPLWASTPFVLVLPVRMAASLPFVVMALLGVFAVRMMQRAPHLPKESPQN